MARAAAGKGQPTCPRPLRAAPVCAPHAPRPSAAKPQPRPRRPLPSTQTGGGDGKVCHAGFWRLLVVREGRDSTFLPYPAPGGSGGAGGGSGGEVSAGGLALGDLPLERWLVALQGSGPGAGTPLLQVGASGKERPGFPPPAPVQCALRCFLETSKPATDRANAPPLTGFGGGAARAHPQQRAADAAGQPRSHGRGHDAGGAAGVKRGRV